MSNPTDNVIGQGVSGYDAATSSPTRTGFIAFPTNSRQELNSYTRKELVRKSRALEANLSVFGRILRKLSRHSVGAGIFPTARTQDLEWNAKADKLIDEVGSNPGTYSIDASRDLWEDQRLAVETMLLDGEFFEVLVKGDSGYPFVQPLDVFEVETPTGANVNQTWEDGVLTNPQLRPVAFAVRELPKNVYGQVTDWRNGQAINMVHLYRRRRAKQVRGLPWCYSGLNAGIDALDLQALESGTAKLHSALAVAVKKTARKGKQGAISKIQGNTAEPANTNALEKVFGGGMINYLGEEGEIQLLSSDRPSPDLLKFCEYLFHNFAVGFDLPFEVIWSLSGLNGTANRAVLEDAQSTCDMLQDQIVMRHTRRWRTWRLWWAMENGELPKCKDPEWWIASYRGPAKLTVDLGRTADAAIKLMKNGALSLERYYEERNQDPRSEIRSHLELVRWSMDEAERLGVPVEMIFEPTPGTQQQQPQQPTPTEEDDQ
jgi:capsid protein